ncbi:hypothetical protein [Microlunatus endophyticus]|uniref:hypothetical protein n=1 Tax=Microlunatus endophyticus TaxID=1716077 RepID=UPI00166D0D33|nr:hypothetical protein [Microlunatus endophyticus]
MADAFASAVRLRLTERRLASSRLARSRSDAAIRAVATAASSRHAGSPETDPLLDLDVAAQVPLAVLRTEVEGPVESAEPVDAATMDPGSTDDGLTATKQQLQDELGIATEELQRRRADPTNLHRLPLTALARQLLTGRMPGTRRG